MRNMESPQMAQYNWRTSGAVSIMTKTEKTNMNTTQEVKAKYPFRMRVYDDDGGFIKEVRTTDPSGRDYDVAVGLGAKYEYNYGGTHLRWYKGNKLVAVYLTEFGTVYGPESIAKGDHPSTKYVGGK